MYYSLKFIQNGWSFGFAYFVKAHNFKRGVALNFLFWELAIGTGRTELSDINTLWN